MIYQRKANDRGHLNFGWLDARHTFSFGSYFDPKHMGFSILRVINDDVIAGGHGFDTHPHKNMEIITFVKKGALEHRDTLGSHSVIRPGEIQIMSAGTGIRHSEHNHFKDEDTKTYQIWIEPREMGIKPRYEQFDFTQRKEKNGFTELVSPEGGEGIAAICADATLLLGDFEESEKAELPIDQNRKYWIQVIDGNLTLNGESYETGDGIGIVEEESLSFSFPKNSSFLLFDLP